jgi:geranylgeranyl diphosphate synthase type I
MKQPDKYVPALSDLGSPRVSSVNHILEAYAPEIDRHIRKLLEGVDPFPKGMIEYHFGWVDQNFKPLKGSHGKRLRSTMCLLAFEAIHGDFHPCLPLAACIEMLHNFSLIHDDIEDGDEQRRGRPTVWRVWGLPLAINAGDLLHTLSYMALTELPVTAPFSSTRSLEVYEAILGTTLKLTQGQHVDLELEERSDVSVETYLTMIYGKTASLIEGSTWTGALLASGDQSLVDNYRAFGRNLGMAFQIRDDTLGVWGDAKITGKTGANDVMRKKKTFPILYGFENASGSDRAQLNAIYAEDSISQADARDAVEILTRTGAYERTQELAQEYYQKALDSLATTNMDGEPQRKLLDIARFLVERNF